MTPYNYPAAIISVLSVVMIIHLVRRQRLGAMHTFWWLFAACGILVLGLFPSVADGVGAFFGIHYPPVLPIVAALCLLFVKVLTMDVAMMRQESKIRILAQKMAAYEVELRDIKARQSDECRSEDK